MDRLDQIFSEAQGGCLRSYGTIVERYQDMAVGYAFSVLRDFHLAQDAAQEAFIERRPFPGTPEGPCCVSEGN